MTDLSDTVLLRLRQDATFRLPLAAPSRHVEVTFGEGSDRQVLRFEDPAMVGWLLDFRTPMVVSSILEHASARLGLDTPAARALVSRLAAINLITTHAEHIESSEAQMWESRGWRDALDFQLASRGLRWEHHHQKPSVMTVHLDTNVASDPLPEVLLDTNLWEFNAQVLRIDSGASDLLIADFFDTLFLRRTFREFRAAEICLAQLSAILNGTFSDFAGPDRNDTLPFVTYAASFPFGIYVAAFRVRGLAPGVYEYVPDRSGLRLRQAGSAEKQVSALAFNMQGVEGAAALLYTVRWAAYMQKYRFARAYRLALFELAGAVQSQLVATTALGLRTFLTPAIDDRQAAALVSIPDSLIETPMYLTTLG